MDSGANLASCLMNKTNNERPKTAAIHFVAVFLLFERLFRENSAILQTRNFVRLKRTKTI
jgi:hypothetical protein